MDIGQMERIFRAVNRDNRLDHLAERYAVRKLEQEPSTHDIDGVSYIRVRNTINAPIMQAVEDFLKRGTKDQAAAWRDQAETLEKALALFVRDENGYGFTQFTNLMTHNWQGGSGERQAKHALWAMQEMAASFRRAADTHDMAEINNTFFYCLGRRFNEAGLPLPSASEAHTAFAVIVDAIHEESPALLDGMKTDYSPKESSSEIRRLMNSGYKAGGGEKPLIKTP
ncbi:hypothetical protein HER14_02565 [Acidithiobacillus thiooxidans]|nr:hypothetical protein [Acidithiobacillus thiooxidans]MBU2749879.1 hypothetical protein [Acidithiobacillus thiooxidans]MBU2836877.1 hypothetical protein [Acidithiobacillus thiooxidans]